MKDYNPTPIDTSDVQLPRDLYTLMEELAKSNHDTWAIHRFEEGWSYGDVTTSGSTLNEVLRTLRILLPSDSSFLPPG